MVFGIKPVPSGKLFTCPARTNIDLTQHCEEILRSQISLKNIC